MAFRWRLFPSCKKAAPTDRLDEERAGQPHQYAERKGARTDEGRIRAAAVTHGVTCITTLAAAQAAVEACKALRSAHYGKSATGPLSTAGRIFGNVLIGPIWQELLNCSICRYNGTEGVLPVFCPRVPLILKASILPSLST